MKETKSVRGQRLASRMQLAGALFAASALLATQLALAAPASTLVATPSSATFDVTTGASQATDVGLDSNCANVFDHAQSYAVDAVSENPDHVGVIPPTSAGLHCGDTATFTISVAPGDCDAVGTTKVDFAPVAGPPGQQKFLSGTSFTMTITDTDGTCDAPPQPPTAGRRPAAPAVTNAYLNANSALVTACKSAFGNAKDWRGKLITYIAGWMPKPESVKNDTTQYPTDNDWISYVQKAVNARCSFTP